MRHAEVEAHCLAALRTHGELPVLAIWRLVRGDPPAVPLSRPPTFWELLRDWWRGPSLEAIYADLQDLERSGEVT